jgi:hypothetical protein
MNTPRGYSGMAKGMPTTNTIVTNRELLWFSISPSVQLPALDTVDVLMEVKVLRVEMLFSPCIGVVDVDAVMVAWARVSVEQSCIGLSELAVTGEANAKTQANSSVYFAQANPNTEQTHWLWVAHIRLVHVPPCKALKERFKCPENAKVPFWIMSRDATARTFSELETREP